jgi:2-hydroxychromene-2-carboxylate isomerase
MHMTTATNTTTKTAAKAVEFYFDVGSPAAYLAATQLPRLCAEAGAELVWKPMLLGGVFQATGNHSPANIPSKMRYMLTDLVRFARRYGVPFEHNPHFPVNTLLLMRGATGIQMHEPARFGAYVDAIYRAMWAEPRNLNDPAVVGATLQEAGFDAPKLLALANAQDVKDRLKAVTLEAVERGVFGAPTMFVGEQMFWGQDRLDFVREALAAAA